MGIVQQEIAERYALYNADCMEVLPTLKTESVGISVYSPPFPELRGAEEPDVESLMASLVAFGTAGFKRLAESKKKLTKGTAP